MQRELSSNVETVFVQHVSAPFVMGPLIVSPASCEIRSVIRFLSVQGNSVTEIHRRLSRVYGNGVMSDGFVREWCRKLKDRRTKVHDEEGR